MAYMMNRPNAVAKAYLKMVPYWVIKNPSDPSLITSAISCMALGPWSFSRISHSIQKLMRTKMIEKFQAIKGIRAEADDEIQM